MSELHRNHVAITETESMALMDKRMPSDLLSGPFGQTLELGGSRFADDSLGYCAAVTAPYIVNGPQLHWNLLAMAPFGHGVT